MKSVSATLKTLGLSEDQAAKLAGLQETGRKIDFVYHHSDDGRDPKQTANQFADFRNRLAAFSAEGSLAQKFAAALWDHLTPRYVGWRPEFIEGVEAGSLGDVLTRLDQAIDVKLGRDIPAVVHEASREIRARFDDLLLAYETGSWRDTRTSGEVRDELAFVAAFDEKIRNVLYGNAREIDVRVTIEEVGLGRGVGRAGATEASFEARGYEAQLKTVSDVLDRLVTAGVKVRSGLTFVLPREMQPKIRTEEFLSERPAVARRRHEGQTSRRPLSEADQYWRGVAQSASTSSGAGRTESLAQAGRRGRPM